MTAPNLFALFEAAIAPAAEAEENVFGVLAIDESPGAVVGKDREGRPAILLHVGNDDRPERPVLNLTHLLVRHNASCVALGSGAQGAPPTTVTLIRCKSSDRVLQQHFLQIAGVMLRDLGASPPAERVDDFIRKIVQLFRALERPPQRTIQGLWAELFVMARSDDPLTMLRAWHRSPFEAVDFSDGALRLEVKSYRVEPRSHTFSLTQLSPPSGATVVIASLQAVPASGGTTIHDLLQQMRSQAGLSEEAAAHLEETAAASLGSGWREALREGFDAERARETLTFYPSSAVPSVTTPLPDGVSNVHFEALMTEAVPLGASAFAGLGHLFLASRPRSVA